MSRGNGRSGDAAKLMAAIGASSLDREDLVAALSRRNAGDAVDVDGLALLPELLHLVPEDPDPAHLVLPIHRSGDLLFVAVPDGASGEGLADLERRSGLRLEPIPVSEIDVRGLIVKAKQLLRRRTRSLAAAVRVDGAPPLEGPDLAALGVPDPILRRLRGLPPGLILVSGPPRSGKTTTLRALAREWRAVVLDRTHGIASLEEALAGDPDALAIDETASPAVAGRALRAALEGRRVAMAFAASDAAAALARLGAFKVDPHLAATALRAGLNQRLLNAVCPGCAEPAPEESAVLEDLRLDRLLKGVPLKRGRGCAACRKTGLKGHVAVFEYGERGSDGSLRDGFQPLVADALGKLVAGRFSLQEFSDQVPFTQVLQAADRLSVRKVSP